MRTQANFLLKDAITSRGNLSWGYSYIPVTYAI